MLLLLLLFSIKRSSQDYFWTFLFIEIIKLLCCVLLFFVLFLSRVDCVCIFFCLFIIIFFLGTLLRLSYSHSIVGGKKLGFSGSGMFLVKFHYQISLPHSLLSHYDMSYRGCLICWNISKKEIPHSKQHVSKHCFHITQNFQYRQWNWLSIHKPNKSFLFLNVFILCISISIHVLYFYWMYVHQEIL